MLLSSSLVASNSRSKAVGAEAIGGMLRRRELFLSDSDCLIPTAEEPLAGRGVIFVAEALSTCTIAAS